MHQGIALIYNKSHKRISAQKLHCWVDPPKVWFLLESFFKYSNMKTNKKTVYTFSEIFSKPFSTGEVCATDGVKKMIMQQRKRNWKQPAFTITGYVLAILDLIKTWTDSVVEQSVFELWFYQIGAEALLRDRVINITEQILPTNGRFAI